MADSTQQISFGEGIAPEVRKSDFAMITIPPGEGRFIGFRLALPRDWKEVPGAAPDPAAEISIAATFAESNDVSITVLQTRIPHEINLKDWLEYQCHLRRFAIEAVETLHSQNGTEVHAVAQNAAGDLLRMAVMGDGDSVLWMVGRSAAPVAVEYEEMLGLSAASIRIKPYSGGDTREPLKTYRDAAGLELLYPASWQPERIPRYLPARVAADFRIVQKGEALAFLRAESDASLPAGKPGLNAAYRRALADMETSGIKVDALEELPGPEQGESNDRRWVGECDLPDGRGQIAILIRREEPRWLAAILISPGKTMNPMGWMRGKRFFEIAVASLRASANDR